MPTFEIPDGPTTIEATRSGTPERPQPAETSATYSVTNRSSGTTDGSLSVQVSGSSKSEWFAVDGDSQRSFAPGETQTARVRVTFPPEAPAGDYPFRLRVVAVNDPDNDCAEGPMTTARLQGAAGAVRKSLLWLWILIGVLVVIAVAAMLFFLLRSGEPEAPAERATPPAATAAGTCKPGFVPREASPSDRVCVTPQSRDRVRVENQLADIRRQPGGGAYGPNTCKMGFVWREAYPGDFVCVEPEIRSLVSQENAQAAERSL